VINSRSTATVVQPCDLRPSRNCWPHLARPESHSRPHVSDDNPFSESQFKTLKYRPDFPGRFASHFPRTRLLPRVLPLAQRGALPLLNRASDTGRRAHWPSHGSPRGAGLRTGRRSCPPPRAVRPRRSEAADAGSGSLDQPTRKPASRPHT